MALEQITDNAFYDAYQHNQPVKAAVDKIQKAHHAHKSQEHDPNYNPNAQWYEEAKHDKGIVDLVRKHESSKSKSGRIDYLMQMAATLAGIAVFGMYLV